MGGDQLSEVFDLVEVRGLLSGGFAVRGPWVAHTSAVAPLKFFGMMAGGARLTTDGVDGPVELAPGDVVVLNSRSWLRLEGGRGDGPRREITPETGFPSTSLSDADFGTDDVLIGGHVDLNPAGAALLLEALPPLGHVRASATSGTSLRGTLHRLFEEVAGDRIGSEFAIRQHCQLLLLEVLRAYVGQTDLPPGRLRLLTDDRLRPVLRLMHAEPGRPWGLTELASAAAMSRTSLAERFRTVAGVPPLTYLHRWRIRLAQRALRDSDVRVGDLAVELGYSSDSAFSTAFKREVGEAPLRYRGRVRDELSSPAG
jgi:AraC-like DNA-binding protein